MALVSSRRALDPQTCALSDGRESAERLFPLSTSVGRHPRHQPAAELAGETLFGPSEVALLDLTACAPTSPCFQAPVMIPAVTYQRLCNVRVCNIWIL